MNANKDSFFQSQKKLEENKNILVFQTLNILIINSLNYK